MKDEIKEILETINDLIKISPDKGSYAMSYKMWKQLLDYITNLQEELEKTRLENKVLKEQMVAMVQPNYVYGIELQGVGKDE